MLTVCSSNNALHNASHNFPIEIIELCERPMITFAYIASAVNWVNASGHTVFDGRFLPHADENFM